ARGLEARSGHGPSEGGGVGPGWTGLVGLGFFLWSPPSRPPPPPPFPSPLSNRGGAQEPASGPPHELSCQKYAVAESRRPTTPGPRNARRSPAAESILVHARPM